MVAIERPLLVSTNDEQTAFSEAEIRFLDAGEPIDVSVDNFCRVARDLTCFVQHEKWSKVEMSLRDILNTPIRPGCLSAIAESKLGNVVAHVFLSRPTHENFLSVRLACVAVGMWEAALDHATEQNRRKDEGARRRQL